MAPLKKKVWKFSRKNPNFLGKVTESLDFYSREWSEGVRLGNVFFYHAVVEVASGVIMKKRIGEFWDKEKEILKYGHRKERD